jgi:hypothetical protein
MDESENIQYLNKLAVSIGVSHGYVYLVCAAGAKEGITLNILSSSVFE